MLLVLFCMHAMITIRYIAHAIYIDNVHLGDTKPVCLYQSFGQCAYLINAWLFVISSTNVHWWTEGMYSISQAHFWMISYMLWWYVLRKCVWYSYVSCSMAIPFDMWRKTINLHWWQEWIGLVNGSFLISGEFLPVILIEEKRERNVTCWYYYRRYYYYHYFYSL